MSFSHFLHCGWQRYEPCVYNLFALIKSFTIMSQSGGSESEAGKHVY